MMRYRPMMNMMQWLRRSVCALLVLAGSVSAAPGIEDGVWNYTLRPDEKIVSLAADLLDPRHTWGELAAINRLEKPLELPAGTVLKIPLDWLKQQPEPATVVALSGDAIYKQQRDPAFRSLQRGQHLQVGDEVRTLQGYLTIQLADSAVIRLLPQSRLIFNRLTQYGRTGMTDTRMRLEGGQVNSQVVPFHERGSRFEIETPSALAAVRGTQFRLRAQPDNTWLEVTEGTVELRNLTHTLRVPAGNATRMFPQGGAELIALPKAPRALATNTNVESLPYPLRWAPVNDAADYHLTLIDAATGEILTDKTLSSPEWELNFLENGTYDVELSARNAQQLEGQVALQRVTLGQIAQTPELISPAANAQSGEILPEFRWQTTGGAQVFQVEISRDIGFNDIIGKSEWAPESTAIAPTELAPGHYFWRVSSQAGGNSSAVSDVRRLTITGALPAPKIISVNYVHDRVRLFWTTIPQAHEYRLQVSADPSFATLLREETVKETTASLQLTPGTHYYVRIQSVGDEVFSASFSPSHELFVR